MHHYYQKGENTGNTKQITVHNSIEDVQRIYGIICMYQDDYILRPTVWEILPNGNEKRVLGF